MFKIITRLLPFFSLVFFQPGFAVAQQPNLSPSLNLGDAVVTGFSGTVRSDPVGPATRNRAPNDFVFINPDGPSVRIIDVSRPGYVWDGRLFVAPKKFDVLAKDVGQVFGVALDDSAQPNIYVAATSMFGLNIVVRGRDGLPERRKKGGPGAGWMKGQFGLDLQGGPGSIYKIDGRTGVATLFANVTLDGVPNPGPGLGNLAYDAAHKQLFVSDLYTGMIHRFDLDGKELGAYDHGVTGLGAAKLAAVPFNPKNRPNIANDRFDSEKPDSWGFAPAARQVWGLAVHDGRLYYSVVSGPQIWSVGIERDGSFAADPRWELDVPAQSGPLPISDIAFSQKGAMILAQRALIAGAYNYVAFTRPGEPQVFRVWLKGPNDPPSPGRWKLVPEEYAVGFAGNFRNTNGGVALGYGYGRDGALATTACEFSLWTTGQNLRNAPPLKTRLDPGGPLVVHGLAGVPASPVRTFNEPPWTSYAVDYDDALREPRAAGHLGSVRIYSQPCTAPAVYSGPGYVTNPPFIVGTVVTPPVDCVAPNCPPTPSGTPFDLGISKVGEVNQANPYGPYNFTIGVLNLGPAITSPTTLTVTDVVPAGMTFTNVTSSNWTCVPNPGPPIPAGGTLTCTYIGVFPIATNQPLGWITIVATGGNGPYTNCANLGQPDSDPSNDKACVDVQKDYGNLIVLKQVINKTDPKIPTTGLLYPVTVNCGGTITTLNLVDGLPQTVSHIPFNTSCLVVEGTPPVPTGNCPVPPGGVPTWTTLAYVPLNPVIIVSGVTAIVRVQNTLECQPSGAGPLGSLTVTKTVVNHTQGQVSTTGLLYPVSVSCAAGSSPAVVTNLSLTENIPQTVNNIALSSSCTVTETSWPTPTGTCATVGAVPTWASPPLMTPSSPVPVNGTNVSITVQNTLDCKLPGDVGYLLVAKIIINQTNIHTPAYQTALNALVFPVVATCDGNNTPLNISAGTPGAIVHAVPVGQLCSVVEGTLPPPPTTGCFGGPVPTWVTPPTYTSSPPGIPVTMTSGAGPTITVTNTLICAPPNNGGTNSLTVNKVVQNNTNPHIPTTGTVFQISTSCQSGMSSAVVTGMPLQENGAQTVSGLALNTVCTITETPPPAPPIIAVACTTPGYVPVWTTVLPAPVTITGPTATATVLNILDCKPAGGGGNGSLIVNKMVINNTNGQVSTAGLSYPVTATCGGVPTSLPLTESTPGTVSNLALGTNCSVQEGAYPTVTCPTDYVPSWSTAYLPSASVSVNAAGTPVTVQNTLDCKIIAAVRVAKHVINNTQAVISGLSYPMTVSCVTGTMPATTFPITVPGESSQTVHNIAGGSACTVSETPPPPPTTGCTGGMVPTWVTPPVYSPPSVTASSGAGATIMVTNTLNCAPVAHIAPPVKCAAPMVPNPSGTGCVTQTYCVPPMVQGPVAGQCICGPGYTLVGGACVKQNVCDPPKVPGPVAGQCVCGPGTVPRGNDCVKQTVCIAPAKSNRRGGCDCPKNMDKQGNSCVPKKRQEPTITPRNVIDGIGIIRGLGGGGGGGGVRGGGGGPASNGGGNKGKP